MKKPVFIIAFTIVGLTAVHAAMDPDWIVSQGSIDRATTDYSLSWDWSFVGAEGMAPGGILQGELTAYRFNATHPSWYFECSPSYNFPIRITGSGGPTTVEFESHGSASWGMTFGGVTLDRSGESSGHAHINLPPGDYWMGIRLTANLEAASLNHSVNTIVAVDPYINVSAGSTVYIGQTINGSTVWFPQVDRQVWQAAWAEQWGAVPEPSTYIAGALLLLPFGATVIRSVRRKCKA